MSWEIFKLEIFQLSPIFDYWPKFRFSPEFRFLTKILIFDQNFDFWPEFRFLTKIPIFDQNFDFWPKFRFLTKISIFDQNFDFWPKFSIFDQDFGKTPPVTNSLFIKKPESPRWKVWIYFFEIENKIMVGSIRDTICISLCKFNIFDRKIKL